MTYQLLVFDWDGTLMDSSARIVRCFQKAAADIGVEPPPASAVESIIGLNLQQAWAKLMPEAEAETRARMQERYRAHFLYLDDTEMPLYCGVEEGLAALNEQGYLLAVATGKSRRGLEQALEMTGLKDCFATSRCGDEAFSKPHPQMLLEILEWTGVEAARAVMIGDTVYDMELARNASVAGLAVGYGVQPANKLAALASAGVYDTFPAVCAFLTNKST